MGHKPPAHIITAHYWKLNFLNEKRKNEAIAPQLVRRQKIEY